MKVNNLNIFDFEFELSDNKFIIFSIRRDVTLQQNDLNAIIINDQFGRGRIFDLRSTNYSIR